MRLLVQLRSFASALFRRQRQDDFVRDEIDHHVALYAEDLIAQGVLRVEAERRARAEFGSVSRVREECREARGMAFLDGAWGDLRYAARMMRRSPGFAVIAVLSLGFGLGANTAIFALVDTVLLKSLPVKDPASLYFVDNSGGKARGSSGPPYPCFEIMRDQNRSFSGLAAFGENLFKVTIDGVAERIPGQYASGSLFDVLGVGAVYGRVLTPADDSIMGRGGPDGGTAVISYRLWKRRFDLSPSVLGKTIQVGTNWVTIVGVAQPDFLGLEIGTPVDVTIPIMLSDNNLRARGSWWMSMVGRIKPGVTVAQARQELNAHFQTYMNEMGMRGDKYFSGIELVPAMKGLNGLRHQFSKPLLIVMTIAGLVLLMGCANVANLLLARAGARRNEIAMRLAIGASRGRLLRQMLTEGLLLSALAAAAGLAFAKWSLTLLVTMFAGVHGRIVLDPHFDARLLGFTVAAAVLTALLFSAAPALHAVRSGAAKPGDSGRTSMGRFQWRMGNALVALQIMLSLTLLCGAALFIRTLQNLTHLDPGFHREGVVTMHVSAALPKPAIPVKEGKESEERHARLGRMWEDMVEPARSIPGVSAVAVSTMSPLTGRVRGVRIQLLGESQPDGGGIHVNTVSESYFDTFGVAALAGRTFDARDRATSPKVAILNEMAVRKYSAGGSVLGKHVVFPRQRVTAEYEVVGVVRDSRYNSLRKAAEPMVYLPIEQAIDPLEELMVAIRMKGDPAPVIAAIRQSAQQIVPGGFVSGIGTLQQQTDESLLQERLISMLAAAFGGLALVLAAIGLYGTMSFAVIARTREIGIRIAVGAQRSSLIWLVLRDTLAVVGIGLALAAPLVYAGTRYIESELFGLTAGDPASLLGATLLLVTVALLAAYRPAWRASRVDPMISLRQE